MATTAYTGQTAYSTSAATGQTAYTGQSAAPGEVPVLSFGHLVIGGDRLTVDANPLAIGL